MSDRRKFLFSLPAVPMLVSGCKIKTINYFPPHPANVRTLNVLPLLSAIDVTVNGNPAFSNVAYPAATGYQSYDNNRTSFAVFAAGATTSTLQFDFLLAGDVSYTLVVMGTTDNPSGGMLQEVPVPPSNGQFQLATFNGDITYSSLDVYVNVPGTDIGTVNPSYNVGYNSTTRNLALQGGPWQIIVAIPGTKTVLYDSGALQIAGNIATVFLAYSTGSSFLVNAGFLQAGGAWTITNSLLSRTKVVNAAPGLGAVNQLMNSTTVVTNLAYASASTFPVSTAPDTTTTYTVVPASDSMLSFEATSTPGATVASVAAELKPGADQTVFVTGFPGANQAIVLNDINLPPFPGNSRLRFVNTSPDAGAMNVLIDGAPLVSGLAPNTASAYVEMAQATYAISFVSASTGATLLALPEVVPTQNSTTSIFAIGQVGSMTGLVTQDV